MRRRAFTLVESIATIVVLAIVAGISSSIVLQAADGYLEAATGAQLHAEATSALDRIVRELRSIELDSGAAGVAPDVDDVTASSIDWHGDCAVTRSGGDVTLQIDGGATATLVSDVTAFETVAFDGSNTQLAATLSGVACDAIRRFRLTLTVERAGVSVTLRTRVYLRSTLSGAPGS